MIVVGLVAGEAGDVRPERVLVRLARSALRLPDHVGSLLAYTAYTGC